MTDQDPTGARNAYLARVLANPPASRYLCAANCGQPLTTWHVDAEGRRWHPDCLPAGTAMPVPAGERIRQLEAQLDRVRAECDRIETAVRGRPTAPDFDGAYLAAIRHIRNALNGTEDA